MKYLQGVRLLFAEGYWDGPQNGLALYEGRICWFSTTDIDWGPRWRYELFEMDDASVRERLTSHFEFEQYVGIHTCSHLAYDGKRLSGRVWPREGHHLFYDKYQGQPPQTPPHNGVKIGSFRSFDRTPPVPATADQSAVSSRDETTRG